MFRNIDPMVSSPTRDQTESVPMLKFVQARGNVRVFEWRTGNPPEVTEEQSIRIDLSDEQDDVNQSQDVSTVCYGL